MKILLIDFSTVSGRCWFQMKAPGYKPSSNSEEIEWVRNLAIAGTIIKERFKDYYIVVAADSKSWRHDFWLNAYTAAAMERSFIVNETTLITFKDGFYYRILRLPDGTVCDPVKLKKEEIAVVKANIPTDQGDLTQEWVVSALSSLLGTYKGSRLDSQWKFTTPKTEYKKWRGIIAPKWASMIGAQYAYVGGAEADDIIASACLRLQDEENQIVIMSTDQDLTWSDSKGYGQLHDMAWSCSSYDQPLRKPVSSEAVIESITKKILVGDDGDDIGPVLDLQGNRITPKAAEKLWLHGEKLLDLVDANTWERNFKLIWLRSEGEYEEYIREELDNPRNLPEMPWKFWELNDTLRMQAEAEGRSWFTKDSNPESWL